MRSILFIFLIPCILAGCSKRDCSEADAYNKMLALGRAQARIAAHGSPEALQIMAALGIESGRVSELIAQKKTSEACALAGQIADKYQLDLDDEAEGMVTYEELQKDGGKRGGACSMADAATRQMEIHSKLQARVDAGELDSDIFRQFNTDTAHFGDLLTSDPSAACRLLDDLKKKYHLE